MAKKVLTGESYTLSRLAGILHEAFVAYNGGLVPQGNVTIYGEGRISTNSISGELGLILEDESEYYPFIAEIHRNRCVEIVQGDGWMDVSNESDYSNPNIIEGDIPVQ